MRAAGLFLIPGDSPPMRRRAGGVQLIHVQCKNGNCTERPGRANSGSKHGPAAIRARKRCVHET